MISENIKRVVLVGVILSIPVFASLYIPPDEIFLAGMLALTIPIFVVFDIVAIALFAILRSFWSLLPMVALLVIFIPLSNTFSFSKSEHSKSDQAFSIVSYNINALQYFHDSLNYNINSSTFKQWAGKKNWDIICLQEMLEVKGEPFELQGFDRKISVKHTKDGKNLGLFIFSKYPIVGSGEIEFAYNSYNRLMWIDMLYHSDTIRVANVHLMSYDLGNDFIGNFNRIRSGVMARSWHSKMIADFIRESPYPMVLCGDFNEAPLSFAYRNIHKLLTDTFSKSGKGFSSTFWFVGVPVRIDYIFVSPELASSNYSVVMDADWSDHQPVTTRIELINQDE